MPNDPDVSGIEIAGGEGEKMNKIVDEVDRFFKSVHAEIEDWKFSVEDYGDGTRIFVRFQIHINKLGGPPIAGGATVQGSTPLEAVTQVETLSIPTERVPPDGHDVTEDLREPAAVGAAGRADRDLASFVELWRGKRNSDLGGEYHKEGAPFVDGLGEWNGEKRSVTDAPPRVAAEGTDGGSNLADLGG
jgi:hypothetical protein